MSVETKQLPQGEVLADEETALALRRFTVGALAMSVPEYINRDKAADLVTLWFPGDQIALASLYRQIAENAPKQAA